MDIHVATLCDAAVDYNGKLCVIGTFDQIFARQVPVVHPQCALALRVCFKPGDEGQHKLGISFIDDDGKPVIRPFEPVMDVSLPPEGYFITRNIVLNLQGMRFERPGQYEVQITFDGHVITSIPLRVLLVMEGQGPQTS
ncbi:MAG: DUF6941 family protein [Verrucomicrobiales bacterium]